MNKHYYNSHLRYIILQEFQKPWAAEMNQKIHNGKYFLTEDGQVESNRERLLKLESAEENSQIESMITKDSQNIFGSANTFKTFKYFDFKVCPNLYLKQIALENADAMVRLLSGGVQIEARFLCEELRKIH